MFLKLNIFSNCRHHDPTCDVVAPISSASFDLREEYANAFRTESYHEFWARVIDLTFTHGSSGAIHPKAADRLPSYRLFAEHLLDPDQPTATIALTAHCRHPVAHLLLSDYYCETAAASLVCGLVLKDIERIRLLYRPIRTHLRSLVASDDCSQYPSIASVGRYIADLSEPFDSVSSFRAAQDGSSSLLKRLELGRKKARSKLRLVGRIKRALAAILAVVTVLTSAMGIHLAVHGMVAALALPLPSFVPSSLWGFSSRWHAKAVAQLDEAAKGTYILNRDLDTISRLVARLRDEVEHMVVLLRFCCQDDRRRLTAEVVRQIWKNDGSFNQQLDELEEHLYLCFMTINKARSLVMKEVLAVKRFEASGP